jgi:hypothetical protein
MNVKLQSHIHGFDVAAGVTPPSEMHICFENSARDWPFPGRITFWDKGMNA